MFEMGLQGGERSPFVAMVTRMTDQKGFDLVERVLDEMLDFDIRFLLLGSGAGEYEQFMREAEARHRGRVCAYIATMRSSRTGSTPARTCCSCPRSSSLRPVADDSHALRRAAHSPRDGRPARQRRALQPVHRRGTGFTFANYTPTR